jgi:hypothetical protein
MNVGMGCSHQTCQGGPGSASNVGAAWGSFARGQTQSAESLDVAGTDALIWPSWAWEDGMGIGWNWNLQKPWHLYFGPADIVYLYNSGETG